MLGRQTLLVNPPLVNGVAFTRQGRCQEREEVLGTTKPPYSLRADRGAAARRGLRRPAGRPDRRAPARSPTLIARLDARGVHADADPLPQHDADARRRRRRDGDAQDALRRAAVLLRAARLDRRRRRRCCARRPWTACSSASPKTPRSQLARLEPTAIDLVDDREPRPGGRRRHDRPAPRPGLVRGLPDDAVSGVGPRAARVLLAAAGQPALRHRRDQPRLPVLVRLLRRADSPGPQVPRAQRRRRWSTRSSAATASSASTSSTSGATPSR